RRAHDSRSARAEEKERKSGAGGDAARGGITMIVPILKIALRALARNKARSALTMLGIIIGVASVIAMVSTRQGAQKQVQDQISSMRANLLIVQAGSQRAGGFRGGAGTSTTLTPDDMEAILRDVP